jgi:hypothetical protein
MQLENRELDRLLDDHLSAIEGEGGRIEKLEECVRSLKSAMPDVIETLNALVDQLLDL